MIREQLTIEVFEEFESLVSEEKLRKALEESLSLMAAKDKGSLGLVIANDETVQQLNREYRGLDETTDVLSFSPFHSGKYYGDDNDKPASSLGNDSFILPPDESPPLGEIIISYPQAKRQAHEAGHSVEEELTFLAIHGLLHLLGYDHKEPTEERSMMEKQTQILARLMP